MDVPKFELGPLIDWMGYRLICINIYCRRKFRSEGAKNESQGQAGNCRILILPPEISSVLVVHAA